MSKLRKSKASRRAIAKKEAVSLHKFLMAVKDKRK
jgi:hypothetical protein